MASRSFEIHFLASYQAERRVGRSLSTSTAHLHQERIVIIEDNKSNITEVFRLLGPSEICRSAILINTLKSEDVVFGIEID